MRKTAWTLAGALLVGSLATAQAEEKEPERRHIDVAICLDTSNSMDDLIDSARKKLWAFINDLAQAKPTPVLRVAILNFGTPTDEETGHVQIQLELTEDLDKVYETLSNLTTDGGSEYVGFATKTATEKLTWSESDRALKIIFIAGNESAAQGPVEYKKAAKAAVTKGIVVNTIFCGTPDHKDARGWEEVAEAADGKYAAIDKSKATVAISAPQDRDLAVLRGKLNRTRAYYGKAGGAKKALARRVEDKLKEESEEVAANAAVAQSSPVYMQGAGSWDLVEASKKKDFDINKVKKEALPDEMKEMTDEEKKAHLEKLKAERQKIVDDIAKLAKERAAYIKEMKEKQAKGQQGLDEVLIEMVREQAKAKGFQYDETEN